MVRLHDQMATRRRCCAWTRRGPSYGRREPRTPAENISSVYGGTRGEIDKLGKKSSFGFYGDLLLQGKKANWFSLLQWRL